MKTYTQIEKDLTEKGFRYDGQDGGMNHYFQNLDGRYAVVGRALTGGYDCQIKGRAYSVMSESERHLARD